MYLLLGVAQSMPEPYVLSKIFSDAMGPSNLQPYFYRAKAEFEADDITMATLVTRNRFPVLSRLATHYKGSQKRKRLIKEAKHSFGFFFYLKRAYFCGYSYQ